MSLKGFKYSLLSTYCRTYIRWILGSCYTEYPWCNKESFFLMESQTRWERSRRSSSAVPQAEQRRGQLCTFAKSGGKLGPAVPSLTSCSRLVTAPGHFDLCTKHTLYKFWDYFPNAMKQLLFLSSRRCFWPPPRHFEIGFTECSRTICN